MPGPHLPRLQVYSSYARSHLYYAAELLLLAVLLLLVETTSYAGGSCRGGRWLLGDGDMLRRRVGRSMPVLMWP